MANEKFEKGLAIRKQVLGEEYVNQSIETQMILRCLYKS